MKARPLFTVGSRLWKLCSRSSIPAYKSSKCMRFSSNSVFRGSMIVLLDYTYGITCKPPVFAARLSMPTSWATVNSSDNCFAPNSFKYSILDIVLDSRITQVPSWHHLRSPNPSASPALSLYPHPYLCYSYQHYSSTC